MGDRPPNLTEKLASALLEIQRLRGDPINREHACAMSAEMFVSLFHFHHEVYRAHGGSNHFTNLTPMLIATHRDRTAKIDKPAIAKCERVSKAHQQHVEVMRGKMLATAPRDAPKSRWPKGRKIEGRSFAGQRASKEHWKASHREK